MNQVRFSHILVCLWVTIGIAVLGSRAARANTCSLADATPQQVRELATGASEVFVGRIVSEISPLNEKYHSFNGSAELEVSVFKVWKGSKFRTKYVRKMSPSGKIVGHDILFFAFEAEGELRVTTCPRSWNTVLMNGIRR